MDDNILELFALPIGLHQVRVINNIPLYGSQTLNDKFIQAASETRRGKYIFSTIKKMVDQKKIIPCFADQGLISHFRRRISKDTSGGLMRILRSLVFATKPIQHPLDYVLAFYDFQDDNITLLISNHISDNKVFESSVANTAIINSLTHEMMHMFSHIQPNKFISLFKDELNSYYTYVLTKIFKLKDDKNLKKEVEQFYKFLFFKIEMINTNVPMSEMLTRLKRFQKFSKLNEEEFTSVSVDYMKLTRLLYTNDLSDAIPLLTPYKYIITQLYSAYKETFGRVPSKVCTQELYFPSEVICGYSDVRFDGKIKKALTSII
jgi:hypothetical protein